MLSMIQVARSTLALSLHTLTKLPAVQDKLRLEITKELQTHVSNLFHTYFIFSETNISN